MRGNVSCGELRPCTGQTICRPFRFRKKIPHLDVSAWSAQRQYSLFIWRNFGYQFLDRYFAGRRARAIRPRRIESRPVSLFSHIQMLEAKQHVTKVNIVARQYRKPAIAARQLHTRDFLKMIGVADLPPLDQSFRSGLRSGDMVKSHLAQERSPDIDSEDLDGMLDLVNKTAT